MELKGKTVFIDSSVFIGQNFLHGTVIKTFLNPVYKDYFNIVMPKLTVNEIKANFKRRAERAIEKHGQLINNKSLDEHGKKINIDILKNSGAARDLIKRMPKLSVLVDEFSKTLDNVLDNADVIILDYPTIDTTQIFDDYFNSRPPFGAADKKSEFPDAFAIAQIEQYGIDEGKDIFVFSEDKDFHSLGSGSLSIVKDYKRFIEELLGVSRSRKLEEIIEKKGKDLDKYVISWLEDELNDESIYIDIVNYMEIYGITINSTEVIDRKFEVVGGDKETFEVEAILEIKVDVSVQIDDEDTGIYDSEDKVMLFREQTDMGIQQTVEIPVLMSFYIVDGEDFDEEFEVIEYNKGKSLELERPDYYS
ncbi:PIN domain-containing protein [Pedobacter sp. UYEF25]